MADFSVVADVSNTLLRLLRRELCPEPVQSPESIRLAAPTDKTGDFQLGIFLYDLRELGEYRTSAPVLRGETVRTPPPKTLTLSYMIFLNAKAQIASGAEAEQRILARAMQVLADNPSVDAAQQPSAETSDGAAGITFQNLSFEDKSKIWASLNTPYQVGIYFTVSPVFLSSRRSADFVRVTDIAVTAGQERRR